MKEIFNKQDKEFTFTYFLILYFFLKFVTK